MPQFVEAPDKPKLVEPPVAQAKEVTDAVAVPAVGVPEQAVPLPG